MPGRECVTIREGEDPHQTHFRGRTEGWFWASGRRPYAMRDQHHQRHILWRLPAEPALNRPGWTVFNEHPEHERVHAKS